MVKVMAVLLVALALAPPVLLGRDDGDCAACDPGHLRQSQGARGDAGVEIDEPGCGDSGASVVFPAVHGIAGHRAAQTPGRTSSAAACRTWAGAPPALAEARRVALSSAPLQGRRSVLPVTPLLL